MSSLDSRRGHSRTLYLLRHGVGKLYHKQRQFALQNFFFLKPYSKVSTKFWKHLPSINIPRAISLSPKFYACFHNLIDWHSIYDDNYNGAILNNFLKHCLSHVPIPILLQHKLLSKLKILAYHGNELRLYWKKLSLINNKCSPNFIFTSC